MRQLDLTKALKDWTQGIKKWSLWSFLALQEIKRRYRRSTLGPFWITISMTIMIFAMGPLYSQIFKVNLESYFLYLSIGYIVWNLIFNTINDLTESFLSSEKFIKQIRLPLSIYILKIIYKNFIVFLHNSIVILFICLIYPPQSYEMIWLLPFGLILLFMNFVWTGVFISFFCTRYRDLNQLVTNLMQISFFLTPIIWKVSMLDQHQKLTNYNFFYHLINVIRGPIISDPASILSFYILAITSFVGFILAFIFFAKYRARISYWI